MSENADFAEACVEGKIVFIGPPAEAIRAMGSKAESKTIMQKSGVPLVPGYHGDKQDFAILDEAATRIGYPVLVKASAGGGGKGMRVVEQPADLRAAIEGAKREAAASFGDDRVLIETYLTRPRHVEIQIFADCEGNFVSLFERDCSIQRRHQKVVEEAPAPGMDPGRRRDMGEAAIAAARAVGYVGAGTVEFIAQGDAFYFMEMNTRLQVEHPVTEMITGQDLVEWQLRVAAGEKLPALQEQLAIRGHAIEARIYAEDPRRDFLPSTGLLAHLRQPSESATVRVDTGVRQGDQITPDYDPMIAKLIVWGEDRAGAVRRLAGALAEYEVVGVQTNLGLLRAIAAHPAFEAAELDTGFIARYAHQLIPQVAPAPSKATEAAVWAAAALAVLADQRAEKQAEAQRSGDPWSPWSVADAWRMNGDGYQDMRFRRNEEIVTIRVHPLADGSFCLDLPAGSVHADAVESEAGIYHLRVDDASRRVRVVRRGPELTVILAGQNHRVIHLDPLAPASGESVADNKLTAPIPARVSRVLVQRGDMVKKGAVLLVLEAMKMELTLSAPMDGNIEMVRHAVGDMVEEGTELIRFAAEAPAQ